MPPLVGALCALGTFLLACTRAAPGPIDGATKKPLEFPVIDVSSLADDEVRQNSVDWELTGQFSRIYTYRWGDAI
jgi:hypothetical protein